MAATSADPFSDGLHVASDADRTLFVQWSNRDVPRDRCLVFVYVAAAGVFAACTALFIFGIVTSGFDSPPGLFQWLWLCVVGVGGLIAAMGFALELRTLFAKEWIRISDRGICHGLEGYWISTSEVIAMSEAEELFLGHYGSGSDRESALTLNILYGNNAQQPRKREIIGLWLARDIKIKLFATIKDFIVVQGWKMDITQND